VARIDEARPRILGAPDARLRVKLGVAFRIAGQRPRDVPECAQLFTGLNADGVALLGSTLYQSVADTGGERVCGRGLDAAAFTMVRSPRTIVCPAFDRLTVEDAAVVVLHEALHFAGLPESPPTPGAMKSNEINDRIADRCGL
jgi:hypothetical protein